MGRAMGRAGHVRESSNGKGTKGGKVSVSPGIWAEGTWAIGRGHGDMATWRYRQGHGREGTHAWGKHRQAAWEGRHRVCVRAGDVGIGDMLAWSVYIEHDLIRVRVRVTSSGRCKRFHI